MILRSLGIFLSLRRTGSALYHWHRRVLRRVRRVVRTSLTSSHGQICRSETTRSMASFTRPRPSCGSYPGPTHPLAISSTVLKLCSTQAASRSRWHALTKAAVVRLFTKSSLPTSTPPSRAYLARIGVPFVRVFFPSSL
jgi:hypothetical protein